MGQRSAIHGRHRKIHDRNIHVQALLDHVESDRSVRGFIYTVTKSFQAFYKDASHILVIVDHQDGAEPILVRARNASRINSRAVFRPCGPSRLREQNAHRCAASRGALDAQVKPQLTRLVDTAPQGDEWLHARLDRGDVRLLTRNGLNWTAKYPQIAGAVAALPARQAYLDGELCGVRADGITSFSMIQLASDAGNAAGLVFFLFDLLYLDGEDLSARPVIERKDRLAGLLAQATSPLQFSDHQIGLGPAFCEHACALKVEGIVSKRADAPYMPGNRGLWLKVKCLNREEFVVIGWTDPEGARSFLGALLLGYYDPDGRLTYAGRVGTGISQAELERLWRRLQPLAIDRMPLDPPPPRSTRFGSPLVLSRVHRVRPELVAEIKFLTWTDDNLCARSSMKGCARINRRPTYDARYHIPKNSQRVARSELRSNLTGHVSH